jgi:hypothetical protein
MHFLLEITKIWQKFQDFWFANFSPQIIKIHKLVWIFLWIFGCFESVSSIFCLKLLLILNVKNGVLSKTTFGSIFVSPDGVLCTKEMHKSIKPVTVTRQLTKSIDFHQNYLCDFHLSACRNLPPHLLYSPPTL